MKIAIVTGVWKRPEVFKIFAKGINKLRKIKGVEWRVIIAGSEGMRSEAMVGIEGFQYIETPNHPLARKMNTTIEMARIWEADYVLCLGSDDIISPKLMRLFIKHMKQGIDFIGVLDFYFYDMVSKKSMYWGGYIDYRKGHTCGAGRCLSKNLLNKWGWSIWEDKQSHILDNSMEDKLEATPHTSVKISLAQEGLFAVDIKSSTNMTPFEPWPNTEFIDSKILKKFL